MTGRLVHLHVGAPKTGTTYLQERLSDNARALAAHGVHVPTSSRLTRPSVFGFRAALDLMGHDWGGRPGHARGAWPTMLRRVRALDGTVVISHETLAPARAELAARAVAELAEGAEVHLTYSARDLARQLPAAWQESVKWGRGWGFRKFLAAVEEGDISFARALDLPGVLQRWGVDLPPERIHVVTVPKRGTAGREELWHRYCRAFGIDPAWAPRETEVTNASIGAVETEVMRRLNRRLGWETRREHRYSSAVLDTLAYGWRERTPGAVVPRARHAWVRAESERWIDHVRDTGVDVVGDLEDLRVTEADLLVDGQDPSRLSDGELLEGALAALEAMTHEVARRPRPEHRPDRLLGRQARRWLGG